MNRDKLLLRKFAENADQFGDVIFCRLHKSQLVFRKKINDAPPAAASHRKGWVGAFAIIIGQQAAAGKSSNLLVCSSQPYMQLSEENQLRQPLMRQTAQCSVAFQDHIDTSSLIVLGQALAIGNWQGSKEARKQGSVQIEECRNSPNLDWQRRQV